ncbi:sodium:proton antiporter [Mesorhizobium sp. B4-1-3]|uniref:cation:proton antiporter n=1 Tax=Mesorhizobium sp. B4-1-3 TaxID=2589889 RepID=UPI00112C4B15|nr:sodium:proton antiporter [Mesorhizobium sp. B4-1-3]TPI08510.1 sodium:proton antiporter [Mesorhizobium sp. B4-1-3]
MTVFETILIMLAGAVLLLGIARRIHVPYPVLLALAGATVAIAPVRVAPHMDPELVLALFVAPALLDAAYDTSLRDLKRNWRAVTSLALFAVGVTTISVATVVRLLVPDIPWAAAIAIGAIVAPPDAVAATTVLRDVDVPHRVAVILEGEALLNDASALLIYRLAIAAVLAGGSIGAEAIAPAFLLSIIGSVIVGPALAWIIGRIVRLIDDAPSSIILQFVTTFGIWVLAEHTGLSPILTIVTYAITLARSRSSYQPARLRLPSYAVWDTAVVVLNVLAFLLIGLELGPVIESAAPGELGRWFVIGAAVLGTVISVRLLWSVGAALWTRWRVKRQGASAPAEGPLPDWRTGLIVGWAGTRGIVTVATALALPQSFPERGMLLFAAFSVTLGTLLIQGLTLRPLVLKLDVDDESPVDQEVRQARVVSADAALAALAGESGEAADALRKDLEAERRTAAVARAGDGRPTFPAEALRSRVVAARRKCLFNMRRDGRIGDEAFHRLEEELDLSDLAIATRT